MLLSVPAVLTVLTSFTSVSPDKEVLARLDRALAEPSDKKAWFIHFEKECPASDAPAWKRLQQKAAANSKRYGELSFALAYYGVDYDANLYRVTRPYRLWRQNYKTYQKEYGTDWMSPWTGWGETWFALNLLYLKHHDTKSLGLWLDQGLDGHPAEENDDELGDLWTRHKADMLRAAYGSDIRLKRLAQALWFTYAGDSPADRLQRRKVLADIDQMRQSDDPQVVQSAKSLRGLFKTQTDRAHQEMGGKKSQE